MSTQETKLTAIADAIREKDGTSEPIVANDFPDRIRAIPTGADVEAGNGITITETAEGKQEISLSQETVDSIDGKVNKSGDTMTGALTVPRIELGSTRLITGASTNGVALGIVNNKGATVSRNLFGVYPYGDKGIYIGVETNLSRHEFQFIVDTPTVDYAAANKLYVDTHAFSVASNAGAHNSLFRGKYLGSSVTAAQYAAIAAGTFDDLFIGDYWTINDVNWRIAAFDYYLGTGSTTLTTHHAVIVPDTNLDTKKMNDTNVTTGGYVDSRMYTTNIGPARTKINTAFSGHVLTHQFYLSNAVTNGKVTGSIEVSQEVVLMSERNVFGQPIMSSECNIGSNNPGWYTYDRTQFPLFALAPEFIQKQGLTYWIRDVVSASDYVRMVSNGAPSNDGAVSYCGVRPAFSIKG